MINGKATTADHFGPLGTTCLAVSPEYDNIGIEAFLEPQIQ